MKVFSYGSNMLSERLRAPTRAPNAFFLGTASVRGRALRFHKKSIDGSGKCDIPLTDIPADEVIGVVDDVPESEMPALRDAEGVGKGYVEIDLVVTMAGVAIPTRAFVAEANRIDAKVLPYTWYLDLVRAGAEQHGLDEAYRARLDIQRSIDDPNPERDSKREAERALWQFRESQKRIQVSRSAISFTLLPIHQMEDLSKFESDLWEAADNLRANSKLTSSDYFMPVLGIIFLRHATNRFDIASQQIADDQASGKMPKRKVQPADYIRRRALFLRESARFDVIMAKASTDPAGLPKLVTQAMTDIEDDFEPLKGVLPKDYGIFESKVLEELMRLFNSEQIKRATGDVFGRIYEYFLAKFSIQKAHDNGEFFTPSSLVQLIVNVIEPDHGNVFDPACGSGGMFVQSSHFIEQVGGDTTRKVIFYGQEKNRDTIRIAKMNLAVHGLEGKIAEAITYYQDEHNLAGKEKLAPGKCDFVMANPPFNVDLVDAERIKNDPRLPFGLPGVNKDKRVSNGNYLWISYFWSYLSEKGRAGFVMSSQASSAGHDEKTVRQKLVETGDVDVMISIKGGFFYTRTVPCELWHFDRNKPAERKDQVLMLDARGVGQLMKGSRKVHEFTPEQMRNLTAIVWLYRGQRDRFLALVHSYFKRHAAECDAVPQKIADFETALAAHDAPFAALAKTVKAIGKPDAEKTQALTETLAELRDARKACNADALAFLAALSAFVTKTCKSLPVTNDQQHAARKAFDPIAERAKGLIKQVDLLYKFASRAASIAADLAAIEAVAEVFDRRATGKLIKQLDEQRRAAVEQLKHATYFHRNIVWLQHRFPKAEMQAVLGLVKVVTRKEIKEADWNLTPGRYVGVAATEVDEDFDFEQSIADIHAELAGLNDEAVGLAAKIQENLEALT